MAGAFWIPEAAHRATNAATDPTLAPVTVTGQATVPGSGTAPISSLGGEALTLRLQSTLGQKLDRRPGVSGTYFGPNAR